jgi:hypothetical protein
MALPRQMPAQGADIDRTEDRRRSYFALQAKIELLNRGVAEIGGHGSQITEGILGIHRRKILQGLETLGHAVSRNQ